MKKLTNEEDSALRALRKFGSYCPGLSWVSVPSFETDLFREALKGLVRKKQVRVEETDDGPRYHPLYDMGTRVR
jgi:hypothetical protein